MSQPLRPTVTIDQTLMVDLSCRGEDEDARSPKDCFVAGAGPQPVAGGPLRPGPVTFVVAESLVMIFKVTTRRTQSFWIHR